MAELTLIVEFEIKPGRTEDFKVAAQALIDASNEEPGTLRYDWHISEDGRRDVNLELFKDSDAFLAHDRHVAALVPALLETATLTDFSVLGDASGEVHAQLIETATGYFGRFSGIDR